MVKAHHNTINLEISTQSVVHPAVRGRTGVAGGNAKNYDLPAKTRGSWENKEKVIANAIAKYVSGHLDGRCAKSYVLPV